MTSRYRIFGLLAVSLFFVACSSSSPKTRYYSLFANTHGAKIDSAGVSDVSIGIGPIVLPEFIDNSAIVSLSEDNRVLVSGSNVWAGDLDSALTRVITQNIAHQLDNAIIWGFPWDSRHRPDFQLKILFDDFVGVMGGDTQLSAKWILLDQKAGNLVSSGNITMNNSTSDATYGNYVFRLNELVNQFSHELALTISDKLNGI